MDDDLQKRAADMLIGGATMLSEPCPYCKGVRIIKDGNALCTSCGREPDAQAHPDAPRTGAYADTELEDALVELSGRLAAETDESVKGDILKSIGELTDAIAKKRRAQ